MLGSCSEWTTKDVGEETFRESPETELFIQVSGRRATIFIEFSNWSLMHRVDGERAEGVRAWGWDGKKAGRGIYHAWVNQEDKGHLSCRRVWSQPQRPLAFMACMRLCPTVAMSQKPQDSRMLQDVLLAQRTCVQLAFCQHYRRLSDCRHSKHT